MDTGKIIGVVVLLIVAPISLAIGSVVTFQTTGSIDVTQDRSYFNFSITVYDNGENTGTIHLRDGVVYANLTCEENFSDNVHFTIKLNGNIIYENDNITGTSAVIENTGLGSYLQEGTNTLQAIVDNTARINSIVTTLSVQTYGKGYIENTIGNVEGQTSVGFSLGSLLPIVIAAVALITVLVVGFYSLYGTTRRR